MVAGIYDKPSDCEHPTCEQGECKKCSWNPRSNYAPWHHSGMPNIQYKAPAILATLAMACAVGLVWSLGIGTVLLTTAAVVVIVLVFVCLN